MICILRITLSSPLVSNSSISKLSFRFSATLHPGQAQDPLVLLLLHGTTMILVLISSHLQLCINDSSVIFCTVTPGKRTVSATLNVIFSGMPPYFSRSNVLPKLQYLSRLIITIHVLLLSYLNISIVRRVFSTMHKNISLYEHII